MARHRDSKGRFKGGSGKSRRKGKGKGKGFGSIITIRRKGMGALDAETLMPLAMGGVLSALTALALRYFVDPSQGATQQMLVKWAPAFGMLTGSLASLALYMMGGADQATRAFLSAGVVSIAGLGSDYLLREKPALAATIAAPSAPAAMAGYYGMGAIVPEYSQPGGMGAIVMEPVSRDGRRAGTIGSYGETVTLSGVNTSAFGTPGFNA